jgi:hypothetical protein
VTLDRATARRAAPVTVAAVIGLVYVLVSPPSLDLVAHLLRAKLFGAEGFGLWNNWWYGGHHTLGYSVLFPPLAWLVTPQIVAAVSCAGTAAAFDVLVHDRFGEDAWLGSLWFAAATGVDLFTGRLTFAFGLLPGMLAVLALERRRPVASTGLAVVTALASPVAALFVALAATADALGPLIDPAGRRMPERGRLVRDGAIVAASLVPVGVLAIAFPEGGTEPFAFASMWPIVLICLAVVVATPASGRALRVAALLYLVGTLGTYYVPSPIGSNWIRLAGLVAGPIAALLWVRRHPRWLLAAALPLVYVQWQPAVRDLVSASSDPSEHASYWRPLLSFLRRQPGAAAPDFRVEIPFTKFHTEAYQVAPYFPLARGWERQLDLADNGLFYGGRLDASTYRAWLDRLAVHYVAIADAPLDYSAHKEAKLIDAGLPYLRLVMHTEDWRVYAVRDPAPMVSGPGVTVTRLGPNYVNLTVARPGVRLLRVRFTPYWRLTGVPGCVSRTPDGFTSLAFSGTGTARLVISFALSRIHAGSARCSANTADG